MADAAIDGEAIERKVMAGLKDFQARTVNHVFRRMYDRDSPATKFLVADEVGLGKTLVARGIVAKAIAHLQRQKTKRIDVIYICSNADIAQQNIRRLNVTDRQDFALSSRITLLPIHLRHLNSRGVNFVSFTPGTSFDFGQQEGRAEERALLLQLLWHCWGKRGFTHRGVFQLMRGSAGFDRFRQRVLEWTPSKIGDGDGMIDRTLAESFRQEIARADAEADLRARFEALADAHRSRDRRKLSNDRANLVSEMRRLLAKSCIAALEPDLVILDEFQRFRFLLEEPNPDDPDDIRTLAHELFGQPDVRVLMLSATPYKMYSLSDEQDDDHYRDFVQTTQFLMGMDSARGFATDLESYRRSLYALTADDLERVRTLKRRIERQLQRVMVRTERLSVTADRSGMLHDGVIADAELRPADLAGYLLADRLSQFLGGGDVLEYWKSAPYLFNFMESYKLKKDFQAALEDGARRTDLTALLQSAASEGVLPMEAVRRYQSVDPGSARLRALLADTVERGTWQLLWMPPSLPYYEPGLPFDQPGLETFSKRLVFSAWTVAPQAISTLLSYEAERRMVRLGGSNRRNTPAARKRIKPLLRFGRDSRDASRPVGMPVFLLMYPSIALAEMGDPLRLSGSLGGATGPVPREALFSQVHERITRRLRPYLRDVPQDGAADEAWYWAAPLLFDAEVRPGTMRAWLQQPGVEAVWRGGDPDEAGEASLWKEHIDLALTVSYNGPVDLNRPPDDLADVLTRMAIAGPAVCALRAMARVVEGDDGELLVHEPIRNAAARIAWGFRTLFNVPEVQSLLRGTESEEDAYWRRALDYCLNGNLQAVLDEYLHVLPEWLGLIGKHPEAQAADIAREVHDAVSLRAASYGVDEIDFSNGEVELKRDKLRARYALRFGVKTADDDAVIQRATNVRAAFNSPFWPFVLASTSIGQEGLDFHQYCHAVVHWNLPANPVDLEQREGRVHRYKGHAIRKNLARAHRAAAFNRRGSDPWARLFEAGRPPRGSVRDRDLIPYWIFQVEGGARIERYVPALPLSREIEKLEQLKRSLAAYRLVFGQPRQEDLVAFLSTRMSAAEIEQLSAELRIDLSPR